MSTLLVLLGLGLLATAVHVGSRSIHLRTVRCFSCRHVLKLCCCTWRRAR